MSFLSNLIEKFKGTAKETVGDVIDDPNLEDEGRAQRAKAEAQQDAERLEKVAEEKEQKAAGYKGEQKAKAQDS